MRPLRPPPEAVRDFPSGPEARPTMGLRFFLAGDAVEAEWVASALLEGWNGLAHGTAFAALHDSAAIYAMVALAGQCGFTTQMSIRFRRPIRLGDRVRVRGTLHGQDAASVTIASELLVHGEPASTALTTYAIADAGMVRRMLGAELSPYLAGWLAASPGRRRELALAWGEGAYDPR
jgi:acyl-coenzyme A thioesterase PaaI-like protein